VICLAAWDGLLARRLEVVVPSTKYILVGKQSVPQWEGDLVGGALEAYQSNTLLWMWVCDLSQISGTRRRAIRIAGGVQGSYEWGVYRFNATDAHAGEALQNPKVWEAVGILAFICLSHKVSRPHIRRI